MGDHLALLVNRLLTESTLHAAIESRYRTKELAEEEGFEYLGTKVDVVEDISYPRKLVECRICQDEDLDSNMETPCSCCGSLKYAHRRCVQRWCNEKGDTVCEICHQKFEPGYRTPPPLLKYGRIPVNLRRNWQINRTELIQPQQPETESTDDHSLLDSDSEEPSSRILICRIAVAVIFIGLLILRHILPIMVGGSEFVLPLIILAILRVAGILLLVYVTMMALTGLRRQRNPDVVEEPASATVILSDEETEQLDQQHPSHVIQIP